MFNRIIFFFLTSCFFVDFVSAKEGVKAPAKRIAEWTKLTYIQADNNLASFARPNMGAMQKAHQTQEVNNLVYWHQPRSLKIYRYKIDGEQKKEFSDLLLGMPRNPEHEITEAMRWAHENFPAKHYMLVFWNHGTGIIDKDGYRLPDRLRDYFYSNAWLEIPGFNPELFDNRGILYSDSTKTCMNNQQLRNALKKATDIIGRKIDIVGMDACFMAMTEVAYQIRDCAHYLVGSQNSEPGEGWHYAGFLKPLTLSPQAFTPLLLAQKITHTFEELHKNDVNFYTQSTIDLSCMDRIKKNIDNVVSKLEQCSAQRPQHIQKAVQYARKQAVKFEAPDFLDLYSFYEQLVQATRSPAGEYTNKDYQQKIDELHRLLTIGMRKIETAVKFNVTGKLYRNAHGMSIYFPEKSIHQSYFKTLFSRESNWLGFLKASLK